MKKLAQKRKSKRAGLRIFLVKVSKIQKIQVQMFGGVYGEKCVGLMGIHIRRCSKSYPTGKRLGLARQEGTVCLYIQLPKTAPI